MLQKKAQKKFLHFEKALQFREKVIKKIIVIAKCRNLSYRVMCNIKRVVMFSSRKFNANDNVVSIGTDKNRNSETFQVAGVF